ncbi:hypothetical protein MASR2M41_22060 [Flammeovirgaceae bacterium]
MVCEFENIRDSIQELNQLPASVETELSVQQSDLIETVERTIETIKLKALTFKKNKGLVNYIKYQQHTLIIIINELSVQAPFQSKESATNCPCIDILNNALNSLETLFPKEYDYDAPIPECQKQKLFNLLQNQEAVSIRLMSLSISDNIKYLCRTTISGFEAKLSSHVSFRTKLQIGQVIEGLASICSEQGDTIQHERNISDLFISFDINSEASRGYFRHQLNFALHDADTVTSELEIIQEFQKRINQIEVRNECIGNAITLKEVLLSWVHDELKFLGLKCQVNGQSDARLATSSNSDFKVNFDMSVAQFACFIKTFVDSGIIQNQNVSELTRFFASHAKTKRSDNVSHESFRMKYYNIESATRDSVRDILHTAIGQINNS